MRKVFGAALSSVAIIAVGIGTVFLVSRESSTVPVEQGYGPNPVLPKPNPTLIPTVNIAPADPWPAGVKPIAAAGLAVNEFAGGLDHPRWIYALPNGDILVAESNKPPKPDADKGFKGWVMGLVMGQAGAGVPSANRITLLRDVDGDGVAELKTPFLTGLNSPFGMTLVADKLYVANTDAIVAFPYVTGSTEIVVAGD